MAKQLRLYWMTEACCHAGTPLDVDELDAPLRAPVTELLGAEQQGAVALYLPFLDTREWRRRGEVLRGLTLVRHGDTIRTVPATGAAELRDCAAALLTLDPAWTNAVEERNPRYFETWQNVSLSIQEGLRQWIPELYFQDVERYEDREDAYPLLVYAASRRSPGRPRTEFTFDIADPEALNNALRMIGRSLQDVLAIVERRLREANRPALARRYAPVWHEDVQRAVRDRPKRLLDVLAREAALIDGVIGLGTARAMAAVKPFVRTTNGALRQMYGQDMRCLGLRALEKATESLRGATSQFPPAETHPAFSVSGTSGHYKPGSEAYRSE
jgi:hypothetical protein